MNLKSRKLILFVCTVTLVAPFAAFAKKVDKGSEKYLDRSLEDIYDALDEVEDEVGQGADRLEKYGRSKKRNASNGVKFAYDFLKANQSISKAIADLKDINNSMDWSGSLDEPASCKRVDRWKKDLDKARKKNLFEISEGYMKVVDESISKLSEAGIDIGNSASEAESARAMIEEARGLLTQMEEDYANLLDVVTQNCK